MDSRLLAGAYSQRYKYIEREEIETLKKDNEPERADVLAKARRLSQETNKRRKLLAQKRKQEAAREEKRRQEILNRRHQEQKQATEKYQRCHVGTHPRLSPRRRGHSPTRNHVNLDDALRLVRGSSAPGGINEQSQEAIQRLYSQQQTGRDPLERSVTRRSRASSAGPRESRSSHNRPLSGRTLDTSMRAQLMERSMRNLTSSRSRFEQQLEHHQQLLVEQQKKSLRDFNKAIRQEIDADTKVQGVEGNEYDNAPLQSESLSSLDSLEEGNQSSLENSQSDSKLQQLANQERDTQNNNEHGCSSISQEQCARPQTAKVSAVREQQDYNMKHQEHDRLQEPPSTVSNGHIVGPIPHGYYTPPTGVSVSSTPVIQGTLGYYMDSLDMSQSGAEKRVAVGTALRLPQQTPQVSQPVKQPPPALQYDSQLLAHRRFEVRPGQNQSMSKQYGDSSNTQDRAAQPSVTQNIREDVREQPTSALTQNEHPNERPKAHIYAWTSPPPEETERDGCLAGSERQANSNYSANMVADRVMATNLHPQTSRTISTAATTTWVYQTVNPAGNKEPSYTQANLNSSSSASNHTSLAAQVSHTEIPKGQGQKPGTSMTTAGTYPATTGLKFVASMPPSFQGHVQPPADSRLQSHSHASDSQYQYQHQLGTGGKGTNSSMSQQQRGGNTSHGTLGIVNGRLTTIDINQSEHGLGDKKITVVEDEMDGKKEVRSILKKATKDPATKGLDTHSRFNVQDSVEIAKKHMEAYEKVKRRKGQKKGVRFADLHYPEDVDEDTDSADSFTEASAAAMKAYAKTGSSGDGRTADSGSKSTQQRPRPASARVVSSSTKAADPKARGPRVVSAGPTRTSPAARPKAAAHIIMSGEASSHMHGQESAAAGISVHKSQLDKKVMLINNNFMSRVPMYTSTTSTTAATVTTESNSTATISTAQNGVPTASSIATGESGPSTYGSGKNMAYSQSSDQPRGARGKSTVAALHSTAILPSHSHFSNANNSYRPVYNENGMRIDRTPTDDEINSLWKNMRTMLDVTDGKSTPSASANNGSANGSEQAPRQQVQLSHHYIDGAALGFPSSTTRMIQGYPSAKSSPPPTSSVQTAAAKPSSQGKNGYLQRYSLLQQRRNPSTGIGTSARANGVVEQTVQPMPLASSTDPRQTSVNISYAPREEMSESMAGFLAAEQVVQNLGTDVRDSRVIAAIDSAQNQQEMYNSIRQKVAKGGPSTLSMEEQRLLESLDKLNDRLKVVENRHTSSNHQVPNYSNNTALSNYPTNTAGHQIYVHGSGFRGHQVMTSPSFRRNSGGSRSTGRPVSARLLTRPHH